MLWLLVGCVDQSLSKLSDSETAVQATIQVSPSILNFGEYQSEPIVRQLQVSNVGEATLDINNILIDGNEAISFSNQSGVLQFSLEPTEATMLPFVFQPLAISNEAQVLISSNDPDNTIAEVPMLGTLVAPMISVEPNPLDVGTQLVGCYTEHNFSVTNIGTAPLLISGVSSEDPEVVFISDSLLPLTLEPQEIENLRVEFYPSAVGAVESLLDIQSNAVNSSSLNVVGSGYAEQHSESWTIQEGPKSDIIFSVDLSGSMTEEALILGQQFNTFITQLSNYTSDWQVMVVNADHGCNHSGILTQNTASYDSIFAQAVQTGAYDISFTEALLTNVTRAVEKSGVGDCNEGFLRPNAQLHIIMISDECEQSPNPGICGTQWQSYVDRVNAAKGNPNLVRISAVAGDYPSGCSGAEFGSGYWESTLATGGSFISICTDWTSPASLQLLASSSISQSRFTLSNQPIESSIIVSIDGIQHLDWVLDSNNEVVLLSNIPASGSIVNIDYLEQPNCEQ